MDLHMKDGHNNDVIMDVTMDLHMKDGHNNDVIMDVMMDLHMKDEIQPKIGVYCFY